MGIFLLPMMFICPFKITVLEEMKIHSLATILIKTTHGYLRTSHIFNINDKINNFQYFIQKKNKHYHNYHNLYRMNSTFSVQTVPGTNTSCPSKQLGQSLDSLLQNFKKQKMKVTQKIVQWNHAFLQTWKPNHSTKHEKTLKHKNEKNDLSIFNNAISTFYFSKLNKLVKHCLHHPLNYPFHSLVTSHKCSPSKGCMQNSNNYPVPWAENGNK